MKKHVLTAACLAATLAFAVTACHEVIFYEIRQEVKLADAQVSGDINSIVRFAMGGKEYLFVQSGNIYCKELKAEPTMNEPYEGQWKKAGKGIIGDGIVFRLAADETYLYALAVRTEEDEDEGENYSAEQTLYCSANGNKWKKIDLTLPPKGANTLFCTNSPNPAHRKAFLNAGGTVYALSGETATLRTDISDKTKTCVWFGDGVIFSTANATTTNETAATEATLWYESSGKNIFTYSTSDKEHPDHKKEDIGYTVFSLACTKDFLLAGTDDGLIYFNLDDNGCPTTANTNPDSVKNVASTLSSYYEVHNVLAVDPSLSAISGDIYGTTVFAGTSSNTGASSDNQGLWAYYPGRAHWNRE